MIKRYIAGFLLIAVLLFAGAPSNATLTVLAQFAPTTRTQYPVPTGYYQITGITGDGAHITVTISGSTVVPVGTAVIIQNCPVTAYNGGRVVTSSSAGQFLCASATTTTFTAPTTATVYDSTANVTTTGSACVNANSAEAVLTVASTAGMTTGDEVQISGLVPVGLNGWYTVSVVNGTTLNYANTTSTAGATFATTGYTNWITGFGSLNGPFDVVPGGAKLTGDTSEDGYGNSLIPLSNMYTGGFQIVSDMGADAGIGLGFTATQRQNIAESGFVDITRVNPSSSQWVGLIRCIDQNNADMWSVGLSGTTSNFVTNLNNVFTDSGVPYPINQTFELRYVQTCVSVGSPGSYNVYIGYRLCGTTTWNTIFSGTALPYYDYGYYAYYLDFGPTNNASSMIGRFSMPTIMQTTSFSTDSTAALSTLATPIIDPQKPNGGYTWYFDPAQTTGAAADTNSGLDSAHPLLTCNYLTTMGEYAGFCPAPQASAWQTAIGGAATGTAYPLGNNVVSQITPAYQSGRIALAGDTVIVNNNNGQEVRLPDEGLYLNNDGLTFKSSGGTTAPVHLSRFKVMNSANWASVTGTTYSQNDGGTLGSLSILFEDRRAMTQATSLANCEATQGSFYNSGTVMNVNPFGGTNPGSDGHVYERTTVGNGGCGGVLFNCVNFLCQGIHMLGAITTTDNGCYSFQNTFLGSQSLAIFDTDRASYLDKHGFASVGVTATNNRVLYLNDISEGGSIYGGGGTTTPYVDFTTAGSGNQVAYFGCSLGSGISMSLGSNQFAQYGVPNPGEAATSAVWTDHGGTGALNVTLTNCNLPGGFAEQNNDPISFYNCTLNTPGLTNGMASFANLYNCYLTGPFPNATCTNCIFQILSAVGNWNNTAVLNNCTIDYTKAGSSNILTWQDPSPGSDTAPVLTLNECLMLAGSGQLITALPTTGAANYHSNYCEWQAPSAQNLVATVTNGTATLAQMQTQSLDTGSVSLNGTAASVTPGTYQRTAQASLTHSVGALTDYTGVLFAGRQTPGAYEFVSATGASASGGGGSGGTSTSNIKLGTGGVTINSKGSTIKF